MKETLNELAHLRDSRFGQPWPRHGLKLLFWFANDCLSFGNDNVMISECDPADGDFGFHHFENRYDENGDKLLPDIDFPYYVVGNLNSPGAEELPEYVSKDNSPDLYNSNTDRIIVSLYDEEWFHRVYVTQHRDHSNYDPNATYPISRGLLMIIRRRSLEDFLEELDYYTYIQPLLSSSSDLDESELSETQRKSTKTQIHDNKKTGYYTYIQPAMSMPVINYRPQITTTISPKITAVTPPSSDPAHNKPPAAQNNDTKIQLNDNDKTGHFTYIQPVLRTPINYRPQNTNNVSPEFTAITPSYSESAHNEPPAALNNDTKIQIDDDKPTQHPSENLPKQKGLCKRFCTIL